MTGARPTVTPKKAGRKPDPMTRIVNDLKTTMRSLGEYEAKGYGESRRRLHEGRASAWAREHEQTGTFDALLLSLAFRLLASTEEDRRNALLLVAAVSVAEVEKLDGGR